MPLGRGTPSSPAQNREYILSIYDIQLNALSIYKPLLMLTLKCVACVCEQYTADYSTSPLQVPGHFEERRRHLRLKTVSTYFLYTNFN